MTVQQPDTIFKSNENPNLLVAEASAIGMQHCPRLLTVPPCEATDNVEVRFRFDVCDMNHGEITGFYYREHNGPFNRRLLVIND